MITSGKMSLIFEQIVSTNSVRKCMESVWRTCMWILGLKGLKTSSLFQFFCKKVIIMVMVGDCNDKNN